MYQVDTETIEKLKVEGYDVWTISLWEAWLLKMPELSFAVQRIQEAFKGVVLGDGIGLREAQSIDDYANTVDREEARKLDEKCHWQKIEIGLLNKCYAAPTFFDARGFVFHLPAYLVAELQDEYESDFGIITYIIEKHPTSTDWIGMLSTDQAKVIIEVLNLLKFHPEYQSSLDAIEKAINRISSHR